jgi:hypothetical protein
VDGRGEQSLMSALRKRENPEARTELRAVAQLREPHRAEVNSEPQSVHSVIRNPSSPIFAICLF